MNTKTVLTRFIPIFFILLIAISILVYQAQLGIMDYHFFGFPLKYLEGVGLCIDGPCGNDYNYFNLFIDFIFLIIISAGITLISFKIKK